MAILFALFYYLLALATPTLAETMFSSSYQLRFGNFNMTSGTKSSTSYSLTDTVGQTASNEFTSAGYTVFAGAQYAYTLFEFAFSLSDTTLDLGSLPLNAFATDSLNLVVTAPRQGYTVSTLAAQRLFNGTSYIGHTNCDTSCSATAAGIWTNPANYGFGYNLIGDDIATDFLNSSYFRPFPDQSQGDSPTGIMSSSQAGVSRTATATYQLALDPTQAVGTYETIIYYIATPNY